MVLTSFSRYILDFLNEIGSMILFLKEVFLTAIRYPSSRQIILEQIWRVTIQSISTTAMAGFFCRRHNGSTVCYANE